MTLASVELYRYALPVLNPLPLRLRAEGLDASAPQNTREGLLLRLIRDDGREAFGDVAPWPTPRAFAEAEASARGWASAARAAKAIIPCDERAPSALRFAIDVATASLDRRWDAAALAARSLPIAALLDAGRDDVVQEARAAVGLGFATLKLKVGASVSAADDAATVCAVRAAVGEAILLRLDANRAWTFAQACEFARGIAGVQIEFVEEPVASPEDFPALARETGLPIALDETVIEGRAEDFADCAAALVVKPTLAGGLRAVERLADLARAKDIPLVISAAFESGVGVAALAQCAAAFGTPGVAAGLDTLRAFAWDGLAAPLETRAGRIALDDARAARPDFSRMRRVDDV